MVYIYIYISWISMSLSAKSMPPNDCEVQGTLNLRNIYGKLYHVHSGSHLWLQHMVCKWKQVWENRWSCQAQQGLEFTVEKQCDKTPPSAWQETCLFEDRTWKMFTGVTHTRALEEMVFLDCSLAYGCEEGRQPGFPQEVNEFKFSLKLKLNSL